MTKKNRAISLFCVFTMLITTISFPTGVLADTNIDLPAYVCIDTPQSNSTVSDKAINVSGWSLNSSGVQNVQVYVDNIYNGDATTGIARTDVNKARPGYVNGGNSGYSYNLISSSLSDGLHSITVKSTGTNGQISTTSVSTTKVSSKTMPPVVCIDSPKNDFKQNGDQLTLSGWSVSLDGVKDVQATIDGKNSQKASIGLTRMDIATFYPGYSGSVNSGYNLILDESQLTNGAHTITVTSTGNDGSTKAQDVTIYKLPVNANNLLGITYIDAPTSNSNISSINNKISVDGWSINGYGVQKVLVYVDGIYSGDATIGVSRNDVAKVYPKYFNSSASGYDYSLDTSSISDGMHTIMIKSIGNDGVVSSSSVSVKKVSSQTMPPSLCVDSPQNNIKQNGNQISLSGWSVSLYGVKSVQATIDGKNLQNASIGLTRMDLAILYPGYSGSGNSGYKLSIDASLLAYGSHIITVTSTGNDGNIKSQNVTIYKVPADGSNLPGITCIDTPIPTANIFSSDNKVAVNGWSVDGYGVQKVQVYVDNTYEGDATSGVTRTDVNAAKPGYLNALTSGYTYSLDISSISDGMHTITVKSIGNDGSVSTSSNIVKKVSSQTMPPIVCIDYPSYSQVNANQITVAGWSLDLYGIEKVQVYVDNNCNGDAKIGLLRNDVSKAFLGLPAEATGGYNYSLDMTPFSEGKHTITVKSIGKDGSVTSQDSQMYKLKDGVSSMDPRISIDAPSDGVFYKNQPGFVNVVGWSLNAFGVQKVQVYLDNNCNGDANTSISRSDVNNAYPGYPGGATSGFSFNLNLSNIADGVHSISVRSIGNDGIVETQTLKLYKFSSNGQSTLYNISLQSMLDKQMQYGQPQMQSGNSWVNADRGTVQYYADPMNFMDNYGIYQFLRLDYMQGVTADDLNRILVGKGVLAGKGAQFLAAAQQSNINPIYLVSHALLESGNGTSQLSTGVSVSGRTTYNLFGIGAVDSNPVVAGAQYAYGQGWFSVDAAIYGGASWISTGYINNSNYKQNTLYKMRWNPASPANHQYATDVRWAYNQIANMKKLTDMVTNPVLQFDIPQYK